MAVSTALPTLTRAITECFLRSMKSEVPSCTCAAIKRLRFGSTRRKSNLPEDCGSSIDASVGQPRPCSAADALISRPSAIATLIDPHRVFMTRVLSDGIRLDDDKLAAASCDGPSSVRQA